MNSILVDCGQTGQEVGEDPLTGPCCNADSYWMTYGIFRRVRHVLEEQLIQLKFISSNG